MKIILPYLLITLIMVTSWVLNAYQLFKCDFEASYKGEVIHAVGLFTPTFIITGWTSWDEPTTNEDNDQ